jgi:hypothetical protein
MFAVTADPPAGVSVNVELVKVEASMASLKVAVTVDEMATPVLPLAGVTEVTVGAGAAAVVNDQM